MTVTRRHSRPPLRAADRVEERTSEMSLGLLNVGLQTHPWSFYCGLRPACTGQHNCQCWQVRTPVTQTGTPKTRTDP
jgi:hypothetical protein